MPAAIERDEKNALIQRELSTPLFSSAERALKPLSSAQVHVGVRIPHSHTDDISLIP